MAVPYNVVERGQPGVVGGGTKKYYASVSSDGEMTLEDLTLRIEEMSTVSGADIRAVVYAMVSVMNSAMKEGKIVRLGELGSLRVSISSKAEDTAEDVSENSIKSVKAVFSPSPKLKEMFKTVKFKKA